MARPAKQQPKKRILWMWIVAAVAGMSVLGALVYAVLSGRNKAGGQQSFAEFSGSESCRECHADEYNSWKGSHHALAERMIDPALDAGFFKGEKVQHGTQFTVFKHDGTVFEICPAGSNCMALTRVIGVDPLRQFLAPTTNGRVQVTELAVDPKRGDWFDVFGNEDRRAGEWGHWTGRGMNWNSMCANCHNTALQKGYDTRTDSYKTVMAEMGVGCEACHGAMKEHVAWQRGHPGGKAKEPYGESNGARGATRPNMVDTCGACHARHGELTSAFKPGEKFLDHFIPTIPDETDVYYANGQVRDEDYEYVSFLGSKMFSAGVVCMDCHDPHSGKRRLAGNDLCMRCHGSSSPTRTAADVMVRAPVIDPVAHSHHAAGNAGSLCTDCHMPQMTYMQRHGRHDHGFTIPDPVLTVEAGVPNACNKCHADKSAQWAADATAKWYQSRSGAEGITNDRLQITKTNGRRLVEAGESRLLAARMRTRAVVAARRGDTNAVELLLGAFAKETNSLWKASEISLLSRWISEPRVTAKVLESATAHDPLPRAMVARALAPLAERSAYPAAVRVLQILARDPVRAVRVEAAQSLRTLLDTNAPAAQDYFAFLKQNADQPSGAMQMGGYYFDRGDSVTALSWFKKAVEWDTNSAPLRHELAVALSANGKTAEAIEQLRVACRLAPNEAEYHYKLGLALAESGDLNGATGELEQAVAKDPGFADGWYNLGLAYSQGGRLVEAVRSIERAETVNGSEARYPYARATILARMGRMAEAKEAALRALSIDPKNQQAAEFLQGLEQQ